MKMEVKVGLSSISNFVSLNTFNQNKNSVRFQDLPLEDLHQMWLKNHLPSVKKQGKEKQVCIDNFLKADASTAKFLGS